MSTPQPVLRSRRRGPRRASVGFALMGLGVLGISVGSTMAQGVPAAPLSQAAASKSTVGSGIGALNVTALSSAVHIPAYSHQGEDVEANIPYSMSTLGTGGIGNGLTSVFYPGGTGAHGGDTLNLLGLPVPASVGQMLNDPEIAQAQTGVGDPTVSLSHPGLTMTATATSTHVSSESTAAGKSIPAIGPIIGGTSAKTSIKEIGASTVKSKALSTVHDVSIAKVIKIGTVTSKAVAKADGNHPAKGKAKTVVTGVTIAGVHVTIDQNGLHVPGKSLPLVGNTAAKVVNAALKSAGISFQVTKNTHHVKGNHASVSAGALVIKFGTAAYKSGDNDTGTLLVLGGASIDETVHHGYKTPPPPKPTPSHTTKHQHQSNGGGGGSSGDTSGNLPGVQTGSGPATGTGPAVAPPAQQQLAANPLTLPGGLKVWWIVLALVGAGLFAVGMRRLPDQVLQQTGAACSLEE